MTNKDTQTFQFNQSERNTRLLIELGSVSKWRKIQRDIMYAIEDMQEGSEDFEVIIRRKNDE